MPIQLGDLKLYDVEDLSKELHIQEATIRKMLVSGKLKARKMARKWYVSEESLKEYFSQSETEIQQDKPGGMAEAESMKLSGASHDKVIGGRSN